jgi:hypothetical protein
MKRVAMLCADVEAVNSYLAEEELFQLAILTQDF